MSDQEPKGGKPELQLIKGGKERTDRETKIKKPNIMIKYNGVLFVGKDETWKTFEGPGRSGRAATPKEINALRTKYQEAQRLQSVPPEEE